MEADGSIYLRLEWYDDDKNCQIPVELVSAVDGVITLRPLGDVIRKNMEQYHLVEMNEFILFKKIDVAEVMEHKAKADFINKKFRNSLTSQVKKLITDETVTNQYIFKLLLQIDSKLDEILAVEQDEDRKQYMSTRMLSLSGSGMCLITDHAQLGDIFYFQTDNKYSTGFTFASLCRVSNIINASNRMICETEFIHVDETTRDGIIHMVFERDREKLKRKRS